MTERARRLRREATPEERLIWQRLRHVRPRFTRQLPVGFYIIDLACRSLKIAIEFDGSQHLVTTAYDKARTAFLESLGWTVFRFWNNAVRENPDGVAEAMLAVIGQSREATHPRPLPCREGRRP